MASSKRRRVEGWACASCTFVNTDPLWLACDVCGAARPSSRSPKGLRAVQNPELPGLFRVDEFVSQAEEAALLAALGVGAESRAQAGAGFGAAWEAMRWSESRVNGRHLSKTFGSLRGRPAQFALPQMLQDLATRIATGVDPRPAKMAQARGPADCRKASLTTGAQLDGQPRIDRREHWLPNVGATHARGHSPGPTRIRRGATRFCGQACTRAPSARPRPVRRRYRRGEHHLTAHYDDRARSGPILATLSLGGEATMTFVAGDGSSREVAVELPARSLQLVTRAARYEWTHEIRRTDIRSPSRVSITFREERGEQRRGESKSADA